MGRGAKSTPIHVGATWVHRLIWHRSAGRSWRCAGRMPLQDLSVDHVACRRRLGQHLHRVEIPDARQGDVKLPVGEDRAGQVDSNLPLCLALTPVDGKAEGGLNRELKSAEGEPQSRVSAVHLQRQARQEKHLPSARSRAHAQLQNVRVEP